jgi:hypothetical protein
LNRAERDGRSDRIARRVGAGAPIKTTTATLKNLGKESGLVGIIFRKAQNEISNPSDLARVIVMIADEDWSVHWRLV